MRILSLSVFIFTVFTSVFIHAQELTQQEFEDRAKRHSLETPFSPCNYRIVRGNHNEIGKNGAAPYIAEKCETTENGIPVYYYRVRNNHSNEQLPVKIHFCPTGGGVLNSEFKGGAHDGQVFLQDMSEKYAYAKSAPCQFILNAPGQPGDSFQVRIWHPTNERHTVAADMTPAIGPNTSTEPLPVETKVSIIDNEVPSKVEALQQDVSDIQQLSKEAFEAQAKRLNYDAPFSPCQYRIIRGNTSEKSDNGAAPYVAEKCETIEKGIPVYYYRVTNNAANDFPVKIKFCPTGGTVLNLEFKGGPNKGEVYIEDMSEKNAYTLPKPCDFILNAYGKPGDSFEVRIWHPTNELYTVAAMRTPALGPQVFTRPLQPQNLPPRGKDQVLLFKKDKPVKVIDIPPQEPNSVLHFPDKKKDTAPDAKQQAKKAGSSLDDKLKAMSQGSSPITASLQQSSASQNSSGGGLDSMLGGMNDTIDRNIEKRKLEEEIARKEAELLKEQKRIAAEQKARVEKERRRRARIAEQQRQARENQALFGAIVGIAGGALAADMGASADQAVQFGADLAGAVNGDKGAMQRLIDQKQQTELANQQRELENLRQMRTEMNRARGIQTQTPSSSSGISTQTIFGGSSSNSLNRGTPDRDYFSRQGKPEYTNCSRFSNDPQIGTQCQAAMHYYDIYRNNFNNADVSMESLNAAYRNHQRAAQLVIRMAARLSSSGGFETNAQPSTSSRTGVSQGTNDFCDKPENANSCACREGPTTCR